MSELPWVPGYMPEWQWVQELDRYLEEDEFLQQNRGGALVGEGVGGLVAAAAAAAGVLYAAGAAATAAAPAVTAAEAAGAKAIAAGGASALAYQLGHKAGQATARAVLKNTAYAALTVGRATGAYAGAGIQSGARWIRAKIQEL